MRKMWFSGSQTVGLPEGIGNKRKYTNITSRYGWWFINPLTNIIWLVVSTILKNMKVNGKDDIPYIMENNIHVWNHQPVI